MGQIRKRHRKETQRIRQTAQTIIDMLDERDEEMASLRYRNSELEKRNKDLADEVEYWKDRYFSR